jgi:hypothetical protein
LGGAGVVEEEGGRGGEVFVDAGSTTPHTQPLSASHTCRDLRDAQLASAVALRSSDRESRRVMIAVMISVTRRRCRRGYRQNRAGRTAVRHGFEEQPLLDVKYR